MGGFTLIEAITAAAVIAIVTAAGLPSMHGLLVSSRATTVGNRLLADMSRARSEAIMNRIPSVVCPSNDGSTCSQSSDWSHGWIVFVDRNGDDQRAASEQLLSVTSGSDLGGLKVTTSAGRDKARFLPDGKSGGTNQSMHVCDGPTLTRSVVINISGRTRIEQPTGTNAGCDPIAPH